MPLYEYKCDKCGTAFEVIQKLADSPMRTCPQCGGSVKKVISAPALQFKGSGFYITDYAKKDRQPPGSKPTPKETKASTPAPPAADKKTDKEAASSPK
jgi:putative FmdB family regulatory protein